MSGATEAATLAAVLAALAVALLVRPRPDAVPAPTPERRAGSTGRDSALLRRIRPAMALGATAGGWAVIGGPAGWVVGAVGAAVVWVVLGRVEPPSVVRRRERLAADLPTAVDLLAACLGAGAAPGPALETVSRALGGPVGEELLVLHHRLAVGVDPVEVWRSVAGHAQLAPLGRALGRACETGASVAPAARRLGEELRAQARAEVEARARTVEVKAAAPLGLCLLPAFVVLGVVPMVASVFGAMRLF